LKAVRPSEHQEDMKVVKKVILQIAEVRKSNDLPTDLKLFMHVMCQYKPEDALLVVKQPGPKRESQKLLLFMQLFEHFEVLKLTDKNKFQKVVANLPFQNVWKS
jgi:hypothetical protein